MQKHVNLVDLVKSFPTSIYLQNLTSIQKRTSPVKFTHLRKNVDDFWLNFLDLSGAKMCKYYRSRQELSNEYLLAKIGVDTAENEPLEVWGKIQSIIQLPP